MNETEAATRQLLVNGGYSVGELHVEDCNVVIFENATVLGFVLLYKDSLGLLENWRVHSDLVLRETQFSLRQAGEKAWNTYTVFLSEDRANPTLTVAGHIVDSTGSPARGKSGSYASESGS